MADTEEQRQEGEPLDAYLQEAARLGEEGRWEEAFELLNSAESSFRDDPLLLCTLGVVAGEMEARGVAYDFFRRALSAQPQDPHLLMTLGTALARYDDPDAEGVLRLAVVTAPELAEAHLHYGAYLAREGIFDVALAELRSAQELQPDDARVLRELATAQLLSGAVEQGAETMEQAAGADEDPDTRLLLGLALLPLGRLEEAAEELVRAAADLPADGDAQLAAALAAASQGWMDEAWSALARAEAAPAPPEPELLQDAEEVLEEDPDAVLSLLREEVAPPLLRERLLERL